MARRRHRQSQQPTRPERTPVDPESASPFSHMTPLSLTQLRHKIEVSARAGPLPDPETLRQYRDVKDDLPERIVCVFEAQANRRLKNEAMAAWVEAAQRVGSLLIGGATTLGLGYAGINVVLTGGPNATAFALIAGALAPIIAGYVTRAKPQQKK